MNRTHISQLIKSLLIEIEGPNPRPGIEETPDRVARAYEEIFEGYSVNISDLFKCFDGEGTDQIVCIKDIEFYSTCEHHILTFSGTVDVAYLPSKRVIGASKIPRLVNAYAHRLQIQERLAEQIANTLMCELEPRGVGVIIHAKHLCMACRGVKNSSSTMVNSVMLGEFRNNSTTRMEVLSLLGLKN